MSCEYCTDPDGASCFPSYGVAPHTCFYKIPGATIGQSVPLPREEWPENFREDPDCPGMGIYWCPHCGDGNPAGAPASPPALNQEGGSIDVLPALKAGDSYS